MTPEQKAALEAMQKHGSQRKAADALGISRGAIRGRLDAIARVDPAIVQGMKAMGTGLVPNLAWIKTKPTEDEPGYSFMLRPEAPDAIDIAERIREAFEGMEPTAAIIAPEKVVEDLCTVYPLMDVHLGMHAWGRETNDVDYDIKLATADMRMAFAKVLALTPPSAQAVLIVGGDFFHADDNRAETPASKHKLDTDGRFDKVVDVGISILVDAIDRLRERHGAVRVRVLRGNHDENSHRVLRVGLMAWYRQEPRVTVDREPADLFMMQWGRCAVFAHHGDKAKPQQSALYISDICPFWSMTRHRYYLTGHVHHDQAKDIGPLRWESLRAFCPPDAHAASMGYGARRALQSITFHKQDGLVLRALDPIERTA